MKCVLVASLLLLLATAGIALTGDNVEIYLKDGQLRAPLIIREGQGIKGIEYKIEPDGKWAWLSVDGKKAAVTRKGALSKETLQGLAEQLARYDLVNLKSSPKAAFNPHVYAIEFGRINCAIYLPTNQRLPEAKAGSTANMAERYSGVLKAVEEAISKRR